jgi:hypothetical protein
MTDKDRVELSTTPQQQLHYVYITLKEVISLSWEYIREKGLWKTK